MKTQINITIDKEVLGKIHKKRKLVPLSIYINEMLKNMLKKNGKS